MGAAEAYSRDWGCPPAFPGEADPGYSSNGPNRRKDIPDATLFVPGRQIPLLLFKEIRDLYEVRAILEGGAVKLAAQKIDLKKLEDFEQVI